MSNGQPASLWPIEQPSIAPSSTLWGVLPPAPLVQPVNQTIPASQSQSPAGQSQSMLPLNYPVPKIPGDPNSPMQARIPVENIIAAPDCITFTAPGLVVRIYMNERGDLYAKQIQGPNAGKSCNWTEGRWL